MVTVREHVKCVPTSVISLDKMIRNMRTEKKEKKINKMVVERRMKREEDKDEEERRKA